MTEQLMMTAQELSEFRAWLNRRAPNSDDGEFLPVRTSSLHRLLATVDALTQRAERAEGELAAHQKQTDSWLQDMGKRVDEALALADARGRALEELVRLTDRKHVAWDEAKETLSLTPPQALREREEYVGALDEALKPITNCLSDPLWDACEEVCLSPSQVEAIGKALAKKGER